MNYIDFHCDTLRMYSSPVPSGETLWQNRRSVDFQRMVASHCAAQFFAVFFPPKDQLEQEDLPYFHQLYLAFRKNLDIHKDHIALTTDYPSYLRHRRENRISAFLTFEDGRLIHGCHENIHFYYYLGVRLITLTWNTPNCFGYPASDDPNQMSRGLTPFGCEAIEHMNQLGIIIDVSHLSDGGFWDVARLSQRPFVASHSNARSLSPHRRNLTDPMIRCLADKGGIIGVNFAPAFLSPDPSNTHSSLSLICDHIQHLYRIGGAECIALGSDWDGITGELDIPDPTFLPLLFNELQRRGFPASLVEKLAYKNGARLLRDCL